MSTLTIGKVRPTYKGEWDSTITYEVLDWVLYRGFAWQAIQDVPVNREPDVTPAYWAQTGMKGDKGDKGDKGLQGATGVEGRNGLDGVQGPQGVGPKHKWASTTLSFENPDGTWASAVNLIGPQGVIGPEGPVGKQGIAGPVGPQGPTGAQGLQGNPGATPALNNTVTSTSTTHAATANAAKLAYDRGTAGVTAAATAQTAANAAKTAAATAQTSANTAQTTANAAKTAAATAQTSANAAKIAADVANSGVNILGTLFIGAPIYLSTTTLPANCMWADGSLALLADWPQFAAKYKAGGFAGMVLAANSTQAIKDANLGKFVLNANSTGLYMPRYGGQFMRGWTPGKGTAGAWGRDEIRNITGFMTIGGNNNYARFGTVGGAFTGTSSNPSGAGNGSSDGGLWAGVDFNASKVVNTGLENVPQHIRQPVVIYMGVHA